MSDNEKESFYDEYGIDSLIEAVQDISGEIEDTKSTFRITNGAKNGNKISFKKYESGWTGGSRAKIKTYKIAPIAKTVSKLFLGVDILRSLKELKEGYDKKNSFQSKEFYGAVGSVAGSWASAEAGAILGAKVGSLFSPGVGTIIGAVLGGVSGLIGGSKVGNWIGEKIFKRVDKLKNEEDSVNDKNLSGEGKTGGIEFEIPKEIKNFKNLIFFNIDSQNIIFNVKLSNLNEVLDVANRFLNLKNEKFTSINQVFQTILTEIYGGFIGEGILPYVSLNFNNNGLLYSIMPNYYKKTLTGNILGYLDYFLKGFVNGGFFKESFSNEWYKNKNTDFNYLNSNFISLKKYIFQNKSKIPNHEIYLTVYDLGENINEENNVNAIYKNSLSAFRIIGIINDNILVNNNIIIPNCSFRTESDFNVFPDYKNEKSSINFLNNEEKKSELEKTEEAIKKMKVIIKILMPQIPYFRGYFYILDMITFCIHYISTLDANAVFPDFSQSILMKSKGRSYASLLPPVFPPLPIKKQIILNVNLTFSYTINYFLNDNERTILNNILSESALNNTEIDIQKIEKILNVLEIKYKNYLISLYNSKDEIEYRTRIELKIDEFLNNIQRIFHYLVDTPKILLSKIFEKITKSLEVNAKSYNKEIDLNFHYSLKTKNIENFENIEQKKYQINLLIDEFRNIMNQLKEGIIKKINSNFENEKNKIQIRLNSDIETAYQNNLRELNKSLENKKNEIIEKFRNNLESQLNSEKNKALASVPYHALSEARIKIDSKIAEIKEKEISKKNEELDKNFESLRNEIKVKIRNDLQQKTNEIINSLNNEKTNKINNINKEFRNSIQNEINQFNSEITEIENTLKNKKILNYGEIYDKKYLVEKINLSLMGYYDENSKDNNLIMAPVKGGCLSEINNKLKLEDISELEYFKDLCKIIEENKNSEEIKSEGQNFLNVNLKLMHGNLNENFCKNFLNYNSFSQRIILNKINSNETIAIKDELGNNSGFYKLLSQNSEKLNRDEIKNKNIFGENLAFYLDNDDNKIIDNMISLGGKSNFETKTENDLNPFLISIMSKKRDLSNELINNVSLEILNSSNENKITPLHYACLYNYSELANSLMKKGANVNLKTRDKGYTPLDILVSNGNYETLKTLLKYKNFSDLINLKNSNNSTSFHYACLESMMCTKLLLNHRKRNIDSNGNSPEHYAFYSGRIDIYNQIATSDIKEFNNYISSIRKGDSENLNEEIIETLDNNIELFLNKLYDSLKKGNVYDIKKLIKFYQKNQNLKKDLQHSFNEISNNIVINACYGRNPLLLELISEIINFENIPVAAYIGKFGLVNYIVELKNMNINMFSKLEGKELLDFAIEANNEEIILEFLKQIESITDDYLSKYLTKILYKSPRLFEATFNYIYSQEKFSKNKISFNYLYNKDALPKYFNIFLNINMVDKNTLNLDKIELFCRNSVIEELNKNNYQISKKFLNNEEKTNMIRFEKLLEKNSSNKYNFVKLNFEHDVNEIKSLLLNLQNYNLFIPHKIVKSKKIWILKYLPKDYDLFIRNDEGKICFEEISDDFIDFGLLFNIFKMREVKKERQMFYFLKAIEIILEKYIKEDKKQEMEILIKKDILEIMQYFEENKDYLQNYVNENENNLLHLISLSNFMDKEIEKEILKFLDIIKQNINKKQFSEILNQQNNLGNIFLFNFIEKNFSELAMKIFEKYYQYFDISIRDYNGNTFLHYLMSINYYDKKIQSLISKIIEYNKYYIISQNNYGLTPFHLAAKNKCNDSLFLMASYFTLEQMETISNKGKAIHYAAISNCVSTLRLLVEFFKVDINSQIKNNYNENIEVSSKNKLNDIKLPDRSTPLYCAGLYSCTNSFKYLLSLGANPFIQDKNGNDAIDIALIYGDKEMVEFISQTYSFINSNGKYLLSLVKNVNARHILYNNFFLLGFHNINISNDNQQNLLMLAIQYKNYKIISFLLSKNINIETKDILGRNVLHYCVLTNSLSSCWVIFSFLHSLNKKKKLYNLIYNSDNEGETALYTACKLGRLEIVYFILLYIELNNFPKEINVNHIGLSPAHIAIINKNYTTALLVIKYFNLSDSQIKNISQEYQNKILLFYNSNLQNEKEKEKVDKIFELLMKQKNIDKFSILNNQKKITLNEDYDDKISNAISKTINFKNYINFEKNFPNCLSNEIFIKYQDLFSTNFLCILNELYIYDNFAKDVKSFFNIISSIQTKGDIKKNIQWKILFLFTTYIIPYEYYKLSTINNYLENLLSNSKLMNLNPSHPLIYWIEAIIISGCEGECVIAIEDLFDILIQFINTILGEEKFLNELIFVRLSMKAFQFIDNLNKIFSKLNKDFAIIQLKYLQYIPPLLENEINDLLDKYLIIHQDYNNRIPLYSFIKEILSKKNISSQLLESCLIISDFIIKSNQISYIAKEEILLFCKNICDKNLYDENLPNSLLSISSISENICSKFGYNLFKNKFLNIIEKSQKKRKINNINDLLKVFHKFLQMKNLNQFNTCCDYLNSNSLPNFYLKIKQITNESSGRNLTELLDAFEKEKFSLSKEEIKQLEVFGNEYEKTRDYIQTEFKKEGRNLGIAFKNNPTIENFSKLIKIVNCGIYEFLKMKPYLIQNLIVFSFYLHYINKDKRNKFKGRLGQILTGEGKSLIISEIALISALMGEFVDIITSTAYLAERDQKKFKDLYQSFGISSSSITENNPKKEAYNGIILYGTNTDFEFTLLREGTNCEEKMFTVPIGGKIEIKRKYNTVIVDESDNLFIDTALNSARIAYTSRNHYNYVYFPILNCVKENIFDIAKIREILNKINLKDTNNIPDSQLKSWIENARKALEYKKDEQYIVRYNEEKGKKEVQIIQLSTGRVNIGSRWSNGLHEFIEVKEGLEPETESNTIASISHPSFFNNYDIIFGLTGTMGSDIERSEILNIYKLDSFNAPTNFSSQRKAYPTTLFESKDKKEEYIISEILKHISKGRPVLILLLTIEDTIQFSNKVKKEGINNFILNDIQKEKEDYIILYGGKPRSVIIATNAAGRGTDIILSEESLNNGGLHVIMGFYPENIRVEFQGIGRSARQGQIGSSQVVFSKDETFFENANINSVDDAEKYRNNKLITNSEMRVIFSFFELELYNVLKIFFNKLYELKKLINNENFQICFENASKNNNISYDKFTKEIFEEFKVDWAEFFSKISKRRLDLISIDFNNFLIEYQWEKLDLNKPNLWNSFIKDKINK